MSAMSNTMDPIRLGRSLLKSYDPKSMNFLLWLNQFEYIVDLVNIENNKKVEFLISLMNLEAHLQIMQKVVPAIPLDLPYEVLISHLVELFGRFKGEWASNYCFLMRDQFIGESVEQYINALLKLRCKVSPFLKNSLSLRVRFINGIKDIRTKNVLRRMTNLTLESVVTVAMKIESYKLSNTTN
ncbi:hypothetical protein M0804_013301 [Polistes exclamans]|nr:hypothetical protein M0804_013301 [Polistes exclamans]